MISDSLSYRSYFPLFATVLIATDNANAAGIVTHSKTECPKPKSPVFISKSNERKAYPDERFYTEESSSLPLKCLSEDFILKDPVSAVCTDGKWITPDYECVPLIYRERRITDTMMIISGAVFGTLAAVFIIIKVAFHHRARKKETRSPMSANTDRVSHIFDNAAYISSYVDDHPRPHISQQPQWQHRLSSVEF